MHLMLAKGYFKYSCLSRSEFATWETGILLQEGARRDVDFGTGHWPIESRLILR